MLRASVDSNPVCKNWIIFNISFFRFFAICSLKLISELYLHKKYFGYSKLLKTINTFHYHMCSVYQIIVLTSNNFRAITRRKWRIKAAPSNLSWNNFMHKEIHSCNPIFVNNFRGYQKVLLKGELIAWCGWQTLSLETLRVHREPLSNSLNEA